VPLASAGGRSLIAVIAILTFLAALCAGGAELVAASSAQWRQAVAREATIQLRPTAGRAIEADVAAAAELARRSPGIAAVEAFSKEEAERLLEPWLGAGLGLGDLPVPRLIVLRLEAGARPDLAPLRQALKERIPGATLDDHGQWLARLSVMANTVVGLGVGLVALVLAAAGLAVAFATRGAMEGNREVVDVLHFVGADDDYIAREFQRRFFELGLKGGALGGVAALALIAALGVAAASWRASPAGDQIEALFGAFEIGWRGFAVVVLITLLVSGIAGIVSRLAVRRHLAGTA
jgi:cell division transport system permease protein